MWSLQDQCDDKESHDQVNPNVFLGIDIFEFNVNLRKYELTFHPLIFNTSFFSYVMNSILEDFFVLVWAQIIFFRHLVFLHLQKTPPSPEIKAEDSVFFFFALSSLKRECVSE
jgi:hypothetical protein